MSYKKISKHVFKKFSEKEGNMHIASDFAIEEILRIVKDHNPKNILEVGLGIGSISDAVTAYLNFLKLEIKYSGTEENAFCLRQLPQNVAAFSHITLYSSINDIPVGNFFDLIIVDGSDQSLTEIKRYCNRNTLIFIEGGRDSQVRILKKIFPKAIMSRLMSLRRPPSYGPFQQRWSGGATLIAIYPTKKQRYYIFKEKVKTFTKRRLRRILN